MGNPKWPKIGSDATFPKRNVRCRTVEHQLQRSGLPEHPHVIRIFVKRD